MKIAVMGAGAIGGYFGGRLAQAGFDLSFIARGAHLATIRENGLKVLSPTRDFTIHPELYPRFFIRFFIHAFVMEGKLSLIRLYFNGSGENKTPAKYLLKKYLTRKIGIVIIEMYNQAALQSFFSWNILCLLQGAGSWMVRGAEYIILIQSRR